LLAIPFLGERLEPNQVLGIVITFVGLAIVQLRGARLGSLFRRRPVEAGPQEP
jgi:drug/metabolite transporter (DMT)-like permease